MEYNNPTFEIIKELVLKSEELYDRAYCLYAPEVSSILNKPIVSCEHAENLLDNLLTFCEDKRCMELYRQVCRHLYQYYPDSAVFYAKLYIDNYL